MNILHNIIENYNLLTLFSSIISSISDWTSIGILLEGTSTYDIPFLKQDWIKPQDFSKLAVRFSINFIFLFLLIRLIYYPATKRKDFLFTYFAIGITVFTMCFTLDSVKIDLAFALGLFAIFGIIRYRTDAIPIKEMTYLFIVIGISVMNALINKKISIAEMLFANGMIISATYALEHLWLLRHEVQKSVLYDRIDLLQKGKRQELIEDLQQRTGLEITRIEIGKIDLLRDTVRIYVYFYQDEQESYADERTSNNND